MKNAKKYLRALLKFLLASVWGAGLSVSVLTLYHQYYQPAPRMSLDALEQSLLLALEKERQHREQKLGQLADKLIGISELVEVQRGDIAALQVGQQEHNHRLSSLEQRRNHIDADAFNKLKQRLSNTERQLSQLGQRSVSQPARQAKAAPKTKPTVTPPFTLFDVQKRGTNYLAIVGKSDATTLSELSALRSGSRYQGWQLVAVHPTYVIVRHKGQDITLEVDA